MDIDLAKLKKMKMVELGDIGRLASDDVVDRNNVAAFRCE